MKAAARSAVIVKRHCVGASATPYCLIPLLRAFRAKNSLWIEFKPAKAILAYRLVCGGIEEIDKHKLFRVAGKIVRKRIDKSLLGSRVGAIEAFAEIQAMRSLSVVEANPEFGPLRP